MQLKNPETVQDPEPESVTMVLTIPIVADRRIFMIHLTPKKFRVTHPENHFSWVQQFLAFFQFMSLPRKKPLADLYPVFA